MRKVFLPSAQRKEKESRVVKRDKNEYTPFPHASCIPKHRMAMQAVQAVSSVAGATAEHQTDEVAWRIYCSEGQSP